MVVYWTENSSFTLWKDVYFAEIVQWKTYSNRGTKIVKKQSHIFQHFIMIFLSFCDASVEIWYWLVMIHDKPNTYFHSISIFLLCEQMLIEWDTPVQIWTDMFADNVTEASLLFILFSHAYVFVVLYVNCEFLSFQLIFICNPELLKTVLHNRFCFIIYSQICGVNYWSMQGRK